MNMTNIKKAQEARKKMILNKKWKFSDGKIESFKSRIDRGIYKFIETREVPKYEFNKFKYFRMNKQEQDEYDTRFIGNPTKNEYLLHYDNGTTNATNKTVYNYAIEKGLPLK